MRGPRTTITAICCFMRGREHGEIGFVDDELIVMLARRQQLQRMCRRQR